MKMKKGRLNMQNTKKSGIYNNEFLSKENTDYQELLYELIDTVPGSLYWKNKEGVYLGSNQIVASKSNLESSADIVGKTDFDLWPEHAEAIRKNDLEVMHTSKSIEFEEKILLPSGEKLYFASLKSPLKNKQGEIIGVLGNSFDVTELKRAKEEAEAANRAKSDFLLTISHELRTPLNGILGSTQILIGRQDSRIKDNLEHLNNIKFSGDILHSHITNLLDYGKFKSGQFDLSPTVFNLREIIDSTVNIFLPTTITKNIDIIVNYPQDLPEYFFADKIRLVQILYNLMSNACKFTLKGEVKVLIECLNKNKTTAQIKATVTDTGVGIPEDKLEAVFEQFTQLKSHAHQSIGGTGLGLSIVQTLVEKFQGKIGLESKLNKGSSFWVSLPLQLARNIPVKMNFNSKPLQSLQKSPATNLNSSSAQNRRVLVVEDNKINQTVAKELLKDLNCKVHIAGDSKKAFKLFETKQFDLIFLDINLLGNNSLNGLELARELRKTYHKPIIAMTADTSPENRQRCCDSGMNDLIGKPFTMDELTDIINKWLK